LNVEGYDAAWKSSIMAPPQAQAVAAGGAGPVQQQQWGGGGFLQKILMYIMIYFVAQQFLSPKKTMDPAKLTSNLVNKGEKLVSTSISLPTEYVCLSSEKN
jgi:hypothetical protein